jgi:hypothetical protein
MMAGLEFAHAPSEFYARKGRHYAFDLSIPLTCMYGVGVVWRNEFRIKKVGVGSKLE